MGKNLTQDARSLAIDIEHARRGKKRARENTTRPRDRNLRLIVLFTEILDIYNLDEKEELEEIEESSS